MIDINNILASAIAQAIEQAIKPLAERITALENNPAQGVDTPLLNQVACIEEDLTALKELKDRIATQATQTVVQPDAAFLAQMNAVIREHVNAAMHEEMEAHLANANHLTPDDVEECIGSYDFSDIVDDHIENHDFDYSDIAEKVQDHLNLRDEVAELLTEATIRLG